MSLACARCILNVESFDAHCGGCQHRLFFRVFVHGQAGLTAYARWEDLIEFLDNAHVGDRVNVAVAVQGYRLTDSFHLMRDPNGWEIAFRQGALRERLDTQGVIDWLIEHAPRPHL